MGVLGIKKNVFGRFFVLFLLTLVFEFFFVFGGLDFELKCMELVGERRVEV